MQTARIFLASSAQLREERVAFEVMIGRKNKEWVPRGGFLELVIYEDFLDAMSTTRLQDTYNQDIRRSDIFVLLFFTKVGKYSAEEFEIAWQQFRATQKPVIFTYFKDLEGSGDAANAEDARSVVAFKRRLADLGHFYTPYRNLEGLMLHFTQQLEKLVSSGFIKIPQSTSNDSGPAVTLKGDGAIAQNHSTALGAGATFIGSQSRDKNRGSE